METSTIGDDCFI